MKTRLHSLLGLSAFLFASVAAFAADPTGTWTYKVQSPKGRTVDCTLQLKLDNGQLTGSVDNLAGRADITEAKFADDHVSFTVVRQMRKRSVTTHYDGKVQGDSIQGTVSIVGKNGHEKSTEWHAERAKAPASS